MKFKVSKLLLIVLLGIILFVPIAYFRADSGWDADYGGGGSYGGGSYDGGSYSGGNWGYSGGSISFGDSSTASISAIVTIIIVAIIIVAVVKNSKGKTGTNNRTTSSTSATYMSQEDINAIDPTINIERTLGECFEIYRKVQYAWSQFNYEELSELIDIRIDNNYKMQLETLKMKNQKNLMEDITFVTGGIKSVANNGDNQEVVVGLTVRMKDYVINETTNKVVRGSDQYTLEITYDITLIRTKGKALNNCPNCGAPLSDNAREKCEYCDAVIVKGNQKFVMSKKQNIHQRRV